MNFFIIVLAICLFVSLFTLFLLSRDDLTLLRKDVSLDRIFNLFFLVFLIGLLFSRTVFVIIHSPKMFLNPLAFFLFPYFPGLTLSGGVIFGILFLIFYSRESRLPTGRIFDFFSLSLLVSLPFGYLGYFVLTKGKDFISLGLSVLYIVLGIIFIKYFYQLLLKGNLRDGSLSLIFFFVFGIISLASEVIAKFSNFLFLRQVESYLHLLIIILSLVFFVRAEKLIRSRKR
ncbi:MAG: prolipoprotein diacylglyceryl transferase family protein [Patescibacteria group bacterium]